MSEVDFLGLFGSPLNSLFRGELALRDDTDGIFLYGINTDGDIARIIPELSDLASIDISNPQLGNAIVYNSDNGATDRPPEYPGRPLNKWINVPAPKPNLYANSLGELGDVDVYNAYEGHTLVWDSSASEWQEGISVEIATLGNFRDTSIDFVPIQGQTLLWNATLGKWENGFFPDNLNSLSDVDVSTSLPLDGDVLLYDGLQGLWVPGVVSGGNANVLILDDTEALPVAELTTLGVSQPEGEFYWIEEDNTNNWAKAITAGEVSFDDFKDVDLSSIQDGQTLRWTFIDGQWKFIPSDYLPGAFVASFRDLHPSDFSEFALGTCGIERGRYFATTNTTGLGMYGTSAVDGGIHVSYDLRDEDRTVDSFFYGLLKFPSDLEDDEITGLRGIRPLTANSSIPFALAGETGWKVEFWINVSDVNQSSEILDYGTIKVELENQNIKTTFLSGGVTYTNSWIFPDGLEAGLSYFVEFGVRPISDYPSWYDGPTINCKKVFINGIECYNENGELGSETAISSVDTPLDTPDTAAQALPVIGRTFAGYLANLAMQNNSLAVSDFSFTNKLANWGTRPIGMVPGQMVIMEGTEESDPNRDKCLCTKGYNPEKWATDEEYYSFTRFGDSLRLLDLADVDEEAFSQESGYLYYDAATQKITKASESPTDAKNYRLGNAEDVSYRDDSNNNIQNNAVLAWSTERNLFRPVPTNLSFRINDAEDVNTESGLTEGSTLHWNQSAEEWQVAPNLNAVAGDLNSLTDVEALLSFENYTLLYSEANGKWVTGPAPAQGVEKLRDMVDVDADDIEDGQILAYNFLTNKWSSAPKPYPKELNDIVNVDTVSRPPRDGQALTWDGERWFPGDFAKGGSSSVEGLYDVQVKEAREGQVLTWDGTYWANKEAHSGRGDGGDFDTGQIRVSFTSGVWGGGDFDLDSSDRPMEMLGFGIFNGGGDFD